MKHVIEITDGSITTEGSHGREHTSYFKHIACSCGFSTNVAIDRLEQKRAIREHKLDVLVFASGIEFEVKDATSTAGFIR